MHLVQFASIVLIIALVLLPQIVTLFYNGTSDVEPEHEYDYR